MTETLPPITFEQAVELSMSLVDFERSTHFPGHSALHIERVMMLAERLGSVQSAVPAIHVAGTKGKGSTSALVTSILTQAGYRVGMFSSPHLHSVCERITVGLEPISKSEYASLVRRVWRAVEEVGREGKYGGVSFFEMLTAMALVHFRDIRAHFQTIEVGLGGRLDSTNIITPEVSVITSISLDHVATLGDTIEKIATEKAGIIKPGVPCVVAPQAEPDADAVFERVAAQRGSEIIPVSRRFSWKERARDLTCQSFTLSSARTEYALRTPLLGSYQLENVATAVTVAELLAERGYDVPREAIVDGVREVRWPGRFQVFERDRKTIILDGAHNPYSVGRMIESLRHYVNPERVVLLFGSLGGHSASGMLDELAALEPAVIAVQSRHPRSARVQVTARAIREHGLNLAAEFDTVAAGLRHAIEIARPEDLVLCTGSLALVGEAIEELEGIEPEIYENLTGPVNRPLPA